MQVILKSQSHPELGDIVIADQLFPIGRSEDPFASYDQQVVAHLSRRHARIFRQDQGIYIADLGSRNGTRLNDKPIEFKPVRLLAGDRLSFANQLDYEVVLLPRSGDEDPADARGLGLTLHPTDTNSQLDPIAIECFPFLIGKSDVAFSGAVAEGEDRRGYLSRRHAHIYARGDGLYIEDLGSTNGTCLNGERLDEHARPLADGDVLLFGGDYFSYQVSLQSPAASPGFAPAEAASAEESHTIMVSSANSFLDIFCAESEEEELQTEDEAAADAEPAGGAASTSPVRRGPLRKIKTFSRELHVAFGDEQPDSSRWRWMAVGAVALVGIIALGLYYSGKPRREVEALLAQERYLDAARLSGAQLAEHPEREAMQELATESTVKYMVNAWLDFSEQGDFSGAKALLVEARSLAGTNPTADALLDMLAWVTELQQFITERGGVQAPIRIYEHEEQMAALVDWWNQDPEEYRSNMALLLAYVPKFKATHAQTFSQLRTLRNEQSVYLSAIDKLNTSIEQSLALDQPTDLARVIDGFAGQYPRLGGIERLQADVALYLEVHDALQRDDRLRAAMLLENAPFSTPPFIQHTAALQTTLLPSGEVAQQYRAASQAWRDGKLSQAMDILAALTDEQGDELAAAELQRKRQLIADYARLQQFRGDTDYGERLLIFYSELDAVEDSHFTRALELEFKRHSVAAREQADSAWEEAASNWGSYRGEGGIRGLLRLEENVSTRFGRQAGLLSEAYTKASYATQVYEVLGLESPLQRDELYHKIAAEIALQRRSLEQLSMVLSPDVLDTKLGMLASVTMEAQARRDSP